MPTEFNLLTCFLHFDISCGLHSCFCGPTVSPENIEN